MIEIIKKEDIIDSDTITVNDFAHYKSNNDPIITNIILMPKWNFDKITSITSGNIPVDYDVINNNMITLTLLKSDLSDLKIEYTDKQIEREEKLNKIIND